MDWPLVVLVLGLTLGAVKTFQLRLWAAKCVRDEARDERDNSVIVKLTARCDAAEKAVEKMLVEWRAFSINHTGVRR